MTFPRNYRNIDDIESCPETIRAACAVARNLGVEHLVGEAPLDLLRDVVKRDAELRIQVAVSEVFEDESLVGAQHDRDLG